MTVGIGGAGCKIAAKLDEDAVLVNVSETELNKVPGGGRRILAGLRAGRGQFKGSRKDREIGLDAYLSVKRELLETDQGKYGVQLNRRRYRKRITSGILQDLTKEENIATEDKTFSG